MKKEEKNSNAEEKIKEAARKEFTQKGYVLTRTRDIAAAAGCNLALLNYYFRSKENLFDIIMTEITQAFAVKVVEIVHDATTSFEEKVGLIADNYIEFFILNPDLPSFVLNSMRDEPEKFIARIGIKINMQQSVLVRQLKEIIAVAKMKIHPASIMMNIMGMIIFPFVAAPMFKQVTGTSNEAFNSIMQERKKMIPVWIMAMIHATVSARDNKETTINKNI